MSTSTTINFTFILLIFIFLSSCTQGQEKAQEIEPVSDQTIFKNVSASEFRELIENNEGIVLDVRTKVEIDAGHIRDAEFLNFLGSKFEEKLSLMDKGKPVYVYCRSGGRSSKALEKMRSNGFSEVYNLDGGILAWKKMGYEVVKPK